MEGGWGRGATGGVVRREMCLSGWRPFCQQRRAPAEHGSGRIKREGHPLVLHVDVFVVQMMKADVGILGTGGEGLSIGSHSEASHGTEMTHVGADFVLVDGVEETSAELLGIEARGGYSFGTLSSSEQDVALEGRQDGAVDRTSSVINLEDFEGLGIDQLGGTVLGGSEEHSSLLVEAHLVDGSTMQSLGLDDLLGLSIINGDSSLVVAGDHGLIQTSPSSLANAGRALQRSLELRLSIAIPAVDGQERDEGHEGVGGGEEAVRSNAEANGLDGGPVRLQAQKGKT